MHVQIAQNPPFGRDLRRSVDEQMAVVENFAASRGDSFTSPADWSIIRRLWDGARNDPQGYSGTDLNDLTRALTNLVYKVEDTSGLEYESNRYAQDLADVVFSKTPGAVHDAMYADLIAQNAQARRTIAIADRVRLARLLNLMGSDFDLSTDDWDATLRNLGNGRYRANGAAFASAGKRLAASLNDGVLMRSTPAGDASATRRMTRSAVVAAAQLNANAAAMLDAQLGRRINYEISRNRYIYSIILLVAVLMIGIMLLAADVTARRDREALQKAHQESQRLSAELARQKAERALRLSEAQFRAVFDGAALGIGIFDRAGALLDANAVFRSVYGENAPGVLRGHEEEFAELMRGERDLFEFEQHVMTPAGQEAWTDSTVSLVNDDAGHPYFAICMFRDLTELKRNERRMLHDMTHDALTGLPNRSLFETKVREQFAHRRASPESSFAVLVIDLDRFKDINQSLGREAGDFVIAQAGHRIRAAIEAADAVSHVGSDEFAVLVRSLPDVLHVELIARRLLGTLAKPFSIGTRSIYVSASIGIAVASGNYQRGEDVIRDADIAMRYAKGPGGRFAVFDSNMHARAEKRLQLTTDLRLAIENAEFDLLYQPIVRTDDAELVGCEALLRWKHPLEGVMLPSSFMPLAEQTGLATPIGRFVLRTACRQIVRWRETTGKAPFPINVNVSASELLDADFESVVVGATREFGVDPGNLVLEITESVVLDPGTRPNALVERLRAHGFGICIDDFGTGYSSLRYLQQFKVDSIKIDRSFVSGHDGEVASEPIVRTLMTLAEAFDVRVVAEGIETQRQRDVLRNAGCRFGQGFYYARALSAEEARRYVSRGLRRRRKARVRMTDGVETLRVAVIGSGATRARDVLAVLAAAGYYGRGFVRAERASENGAPWNAAIFLDSGVAGEVDAAALRGISAKLPLIIATARIDMQVVRHAAALGAHDVVLRGDGPRLIESLRRAITERPSVVLDRLTESTREELMRKLFDLTPTYVSIRDREGCYVMVSQAFADLYGTTIEDMTGKAITAFTRCKADGELDLAEDRDVLQSRRSRWVLRELLDSSGTKRALQIVKRPIALEDGRVFVMCVAVDVTKSERAESTLAKTNEFLKNILETISDAVFALDTGGRFTLANKRLSLLTGYRHHELIGMPFTRIFPVDTAVEVQRAITSLSAENAKEKRFEAHVAHADGHPRIVTCSLMPLKEGDRVIGIAGTAVDVTERKAAEQRIEHLAYHDPLTNLPNRRLLNDRLTMAMSQAERDGRTVAVLFVDLDRFKSINDSLGHRTGDVVLQELGTRLRAAVRAADTVARMGGDEFVFLLPGLDGADEALHVARKILDAVRKPFNVDGRQFVVTASIGVSLFPNHSADAETLIKQADIALFESKRRGSDSFEVFDESMSARSLEYFVLENDLRRAIVQNELVLVYQPIVEMRTERIISLEALLRWQHPDKGLLMPDQFIRLAEETGLIVPIGNWVLHEACRQNREWQRRGLFSVPVAVNVSARQLDSDLVAAVTEALDASALPPRYLDLELTETILMESAASSSMAVDALKEMGARISIDDFGTGYSSLSYLERLPIDCLKIDKSFMPRDPQTSGAGIIASTIISMAQALGPRRRCRRCGNAGTTRFSAGTRMQPRARSFLLGRNASRPARSVNWRRCAR